MSSIKLDLCKYKTEKGEIYYQIWMEVDIGRAKVWFQTPEHLTWSEANYRMIHLAAQLDASTDGFVLSDRSPEE